MHEEDYIFDEEYVGYDHINEYEHLHDAYDHYHDGYEYYHYPFL